MFTSPAFLYAMVIFSWSTSWIPLTWQASAVMPEVGVMHRFIIATPLMALLAYRAHHGFRFNARTHLAFVGLGICLFSTNFVLSFQKEEEPPAEPEPAVNLILIFFSQNYTLKLFFFSILFAFKDGI